MLDEGLLAEARAETMKQEREEVHGSMRPAFIARWNIGRSLKSSGLSRKKWIFVDKKSEETKHRTE